MSMTADMSITQAPPARVVVVGLVVVPLVVVVVVVALVVVDVENLHVPAGFSDLYVGVGEFGTGVLGATPTVMLADPPPAWPSMTMSMYKFCDPSLSPAACHARKWLPVLMVPPTWRDVRTDQYCWKLVRSPSIEGALMRCFCQISYVPPSLCRHPYCVALRLSEGLWLPIDSIT